MFLKRGFVAALFVAIACAPMSVWACYGSGELDRRELSELVVEVGNLAQANASAAELSPDETILVAALRRRGQLAVDALIAHRDAWGSRLGEEANPRVIKRLEDIIDRVAAQKFATNSKLFWHTSMQAAQREAVKSGRPILSLRMLGRLDEDFSCANSRFFRTMLYPDPAISRQLRERFVLHWSPVRKVPTVTIDFGDGRKLKRPLTGNSMHLVLDQQARPIDALPGLVTPLEFANWLGGVSELWKKLDLQDSEKSWSTVASYHRNRAAQVRAQSAIAIKQNQTVAQLNPLDHRWNDAAGRYMAGRLSPQAMTLITREIPAEVAMPIAPMKRFVETPLLRMVRDVNHNMARDTAFNLLALQPKIDDWFAESAGDPSLLYQPLTNRIYAEVFLMPLTDPWLGLSPNDQYVALPGSGRVEPDTSKSIELKQLLPASLTSVRN